MFYGFLSRGLAPALKGFFGLRRGAKEGGGKKGEVRRGAG